MYKDGKIICSCGNKIDITEYEDALKDDAFEFMDYANDSKEYECSCGVTYHVKSSASICTTVEHQLQIN